MRRHRLSVCRNATRCAGEKDHCSADGGPIIAFLRGHCSPDLLSETVTSTFMDDWMRRVRKPKCVVMDFGSPALYDRARKTLSHVYGIQLIATPRRAPRQNGMMGRSSRSLKTATMAIVTGPTAETGQKVLTLDTIARNHVPRSTTGIPPALATTGRADLLSGRVAPIRNRDPADAESLLVKKQNAMRNILNARNDVVDASAKQALRCVISKSS